ncbi:MAG: sodium-dependent transporter [Pseudomonadota bacterium]
MALAVHEKWTSRWGFLFAAMGTAIGLGNLWRFPFIAGQYGGGAFVLVYLGFVFLLCMPIMIGELMIGRLGGGSALGSMRRLIAQAKASALWQAIGWLSLLIPFVGLSYYSVVAGWAFFYGAEAALGDFSGLDGTGSAALFARFTAQPAMMLLVHSLFMAATIFIVGRGVAAGIESAAKRLMPALFILLLGLVIYNIFAGGFGEAFAFLFTPDFGKLSRAGVMAAMGQAFFSVAIGAGAMMVFGAYLGPRESLPRSAAIIIGADTAIALLAGLAIFPILFANDLALASGPPLIFITLPVGFGQMPGGQGVGLVFFVLLFFAAFTTAIGMLEPVVCWLEERLSWRRGALSLMAGGAAWALGVLPLLSYNLLQDLRPLAFMKALAAKSIFESFDFVIATLLLPVNGLLIALFAGWVIARQQSVNELRLGKTSYGYWRIAVRVLAPIAVLAILWHGLND